MDFIHNYGLVPIIVIPTLDKILCKIFTDKARWFQLHSVVNMIIVGYIKDDVYRLLVSPLDIKRIDECEELYYILYLHLYHSLFFKNSMMDYFHHIVFVLFGTLPVYYYYNVNIIRLATFVGCGLPGAIEYCTLSLVKNNKITSLTQKTIMSNIYNYFRYPFGVYVCSYIYLVHIIGFTSWLNDFTVYYTIFMIFFNGSYFNKLTIENATWHRLSIR